MANAADDRLVWIDCEMTGLDLERDALIEVAVVITDYDLNSVDDGLTVVITPPAEALETMSEFVTQMHRDSGLLDELPRGITLEEAEERVLAYIAEYVPGAGTAPLAGNTIGTDRAFLARDMPRVDGHLHYRSVDVSSIKELAKRWFPRSFHRAPAKNGGHRARADILESIRELAYYRRAVFIAEPGPTSTEFSKIASDVVNEFAPRMD